MESMIVTFSAKALMAMLPMLLNIISDSLRIIICESLDKWYAHAITTVNPVDDILVRGLGKALEYDIKEPHPCTSASICTPIIDAHSGDTEDILS